MIPNQYIRTDLAAERRLSSDAKHKVPGIDYSEFQDGSLSISRLSITDKEGENALGKPQGTYITVAFKSIWLMDESEKEHLKSFTGKALKELILSSHPKPQKILTVGLGNHSLTCDAIGPDTASGITVTRQLSTSEPEIFQRLNYPETSCLIPGVSGETGIESTDLIKCTVDIAKPDLVLAVDALASRSPDRLMRTIQLCNTGISPGAGVGNKKQSLDKDTLGVPVIAIGVPTVVDSSTLIYDALEKAGITESEIQPELQRILNNGKNFFVSTKECDIEIKELSAVLSSAIDESLSAL